ncbi:hypothetical protein SAMN05443574_11756 [Haloarcula vallismortis]|uniref:Uncharacterized protein n=2 Tax=Haloarcula vallismortis TaxID=28442 RepID=M0JKY7_HALVA|nr:hypothetical protein [Haloarcula vallismortis]EMA08639.1 hypothetical protein C437_08137 [Haloarcula vallismortis ATCC 29715]SDX18650.1 hypothetical protein SAMN05443574_11756 [Haloarcula vallismortis]
MSTDSQPDDTIAQAIISGSTYERLRYERHSYLRQTVPRTLALQSALLGALALLLPIYGLYPDSTAAYLPSVDPAVASPKVLLLGLFGGVLELFGAMLLVGSVLYRVRLAPLTERQAHAALNAEDFARYVGLGTGGLAIGISLCLFAVGLGGGDAVSAYIAFTGRNPLVDSGFGLSVATVSLLAFVASVTVFYASRYLLVHLALFHLSEE